MTPFPGLTEACTALFGSLGEDGTEALRLAYNRGYAEGHPRRARLREVSAIAAVDYAFVADLMQSVPDQRKSPGWKVIATDCDDEQVVLERDDCAVVAPRGAIEWAPGPTNRVRLMPSAVEKSDQPGYVSRASPDPPTPPLSRVYLNTTPPQSSFAMGSLARALESGAVRYQLKCLATPRLYGRADSTVVYVETERIREALDRLNDSLERSRIRLVDRTPLLSLPVGRGVGLADEPDDLPPDDEGRTRSFGEWVASWLCEGMRDASSPLDAVDAVDRSIQRVGRDPVAPYRRRKGLPGLEISLGAPSIA